MPTRRAPKLAHKSAPRQSPCPRADDARASNSLPAADLRRGSKTRVRESPAQALSHLSDVARNPLAVGTNLGNIIYNVRCGAYRFSNKIWYEVIGNNC